MGDFFNEKMRIDIDGPKIDQPMESPTLCFADARLLRSLLASRVALGVDFANPSDRRCVGNDRCLGYR